MSHFLTALPLQRGSPSVACMFLTNVLLDVSLYVYVWLSSLFIYIVSVQESCVMIIVNVSVCEWCLVDQHMFQCMFHHSEDSNRLVFAAWLHKLPAVHLQGLFRLSSNKQWLSNFLAICLKTLDTTCAAESKLQFLPLRRWPLITSGPFRVQQQQVVSLCISILWVAQQATTHQWFLLPSAQTVLPLPVCGCVRAPTVQLLIAAESSGSSWLDWLAVLVIL